MKSNYLKQFVLLRSKLHQEKSKLEGQLLEIIKALQEAPSAALAVTPVIKAKPRRKMSGAGKARISAAQKKRWAKLKAGVKAQVSKPKAKRKMSAEGKAKISAAAKARWAKERAGKAK